MRSTREREWGVVPSPTPTVVEPPREMAGGGEPTSAVAFAFAVGMGGGDGNRAAETPPNPVAEALAEGGPHTPPGNNAWSNEWPGCIPPTPPLRDAELLAEVYIDLIGARQSQLILADTAPRQAGGTMDTPRRQRAVPLAPRLTQADRTAHRDFIATLGEKAIWKEFFGNEALEPRGAD